MYWASLVLFRSYYSGVFKPILIMFLLFSPLTTEQYILEETGNTNGQKETKKHTCSLKPVETLPCGIELNVCSSVFCKQNGFMCAILTCLFSLNIL